LYFARQKVDVAIIEVGLGGRLDATNVITPTVSVISSIDLDHTKILGSTIEEIAVEKAGIIKQEVPVVCGETNSNLLKLFRNICDQRKSELFERETEYELTRSDLYGQCFISKNVGYTLGMLGKHQIENALTVLKTVEVLNKQGFTVSNESVQQGLLETKWPGRLELYSLNPTILLDGAHNLAGMNTLCDFLKENEEEEEELFENKNSVCIVGISIGKDVKAMLSKLSEFFDSIIVVNAEHRAIPKEEVALIAVDLFVDVTICDLSDAIDLAREKVGKKGFALISGSLYVVGDILKFINKEKKKTDGLNLVGAIGNV
jgi:dihydrofolate synthase / folylpolyglutamate synthase